MPPAYGYCMVLYCMYCMLYTGFGKSSMPLQVARSSHILAASEALARPWVEVREYWNLTLCQTLYIHLSVISNQHSYGMENMYLLRSTGLGKRVVPRLRELAPHSQRESGGGIHAT